MSQPPTSRTAPRKGMILAAGLGTRLLPITLEMPKPLVPVLGVPNIMHTLSLFKQAGITEAILNVHHLPEPLESYLGSGERWGMRLAFSHEPKLLGTGGGVKKAEPFFEGERFVLANCDFITDIALQPVIQSHLARQALATMVLLEDPVLQPHYSKVGTDENGNLCSLPKCETKAPRRSGIFTGIHVLEPETLRYLEAVPSGINDILYPALLRETPSRVDGFYVSQVYWHDTGELKVLWKTSMKLLETLRHTPGPLVECLRQFGDLEEKTRGVWAPRDERLPTGIELVPPVVMGRSLVIEKGAHIGPFTILGDETKVGSGARVSSFVALGAAEISSEAVSHGALQFHRSVLFSERLPSLEARS